MGQPTTHGRRKAIHQQIRRTGTQGLRLCPPDNGRVHVKLLD